MTDPTGLEPEWHVTVSIPMRLSGEHKEALFDAVAFAAHAWQPEDRDRWDVLVSGHPDDDVVPRYVAKALGLDRERVTCDDVLAAISALRAANRPDVVDASLEWCRDCQRAATTVLHTVSGVARCGTCGSDLGPRPAEGHDDEVRR